MVNKIQVSKINEKVKNRGSMKKFLHYPMIRICIFLAYELPSFSAREKNIELRVHF